MGGSRNYTQGTSRALATEILEGKERRSCPLDPIEVEEIYKDRIGKATPCGNLDNFPRPKTIVSEKENETMLSPITDKEICKCIARVKRDSAPGVDGITRQAILVHLKEKPGELRSLFRSMQVSNFVPSCLTPNRSILLPKSGDPTIVNNWRPLTIGTLVLRLYTAMLARRISNAVKLNPRQRGFIPAQGCFENLYLLQGIMRDAQASGRYLAVTFIDLAKAFDTISHEHVVKGLERFGVDCQMIGMVKALCDKFTNISMLMIVD